MVLSSMHIFDEETWWAEELIREEEGVEEH
jgi:hypothetical protein